MRSTGAPAAARVRQVDAPASAWSLRLPQLEDPHAWTIRSERGAPDAQIDGAMKDHTLRSLSGLLWERDGDVVGVERDAWMPTSPSEECVVLAERNPIPLSGSYVGTRELWLDSSSLRLRKIVLNFRKRGEVAPNAWCQLVCVFNNERIHERPVLGAGLVAGQVVDLPDEQMRFVIDGRSKDATAR